MGITHPSAAGQERVVRMAYEKAKLDPTLTAYAELHGTGTPVGDPIEVRAISRALNDRRPTDKPLLVGAGKGPVSVLRPSFGANLFDSQAEHRTFRSGEWHIRCYESSTNDRVCDDPWCCVFPKLEP